jgi:hypothetical protein
MQGNLSRSLGVVLAVAAMTVPPSFAAAQIGAAGTASAPSPEVVARADALFRDAIKLYREKRYAEAEAGFLAAWKLNPTYDVAGNLGHAEARLGKYREAAEYLAFALRTFPLTGGADKRKWAQDKLNEMRKLVASVRVQVSAPRAEVFVDGKSVGVAPLAGELFLEPGVHTVEAKLEGHEDARQSIQAEKGAAETITLALVAAVSAPAVPPASATTTGSVAHPPLPPKGEPHAGGNKVIVGVGAGVSGAALIAGIVFTVLANSKASDAKQQLDKVVRTDGPEACGLQPNADCKVLHGLVSDKSTYSSLAGWSFISAGAFGAATVIYALAAPRAVTKTGLRAAPTLTAAGGGLVVGGAW